MLRRVWMMVAVVVAVCCAWPAWAVTWYVHGQSGNDSTGLGTATAPYATLTKLITPTLMLSAGDEVCLAGKLYESVTLTSPVAITLRQWPGQTHYDFRGDRPITGFTSIGSGGYTKNIGAGLAVKGVVCDWDANVESNGLHYGHLVPAADATAAGSSSGTANGWFYNSGTGLLTFNLSGDNPASHTVAYCLGGSGVNAITFTDADSLRILDLRASLWVGYKTNETPIAASGQAVRGHGVNCLVEVDQVLDCAYHHVCFADGLCSGNTVAPSPGGRGVLAGVNDGGIPLVFHTNTAGQTGNEARGLTIYCTPFLKRDGSPVSTSHSIGGCFSHTTGGGVKLDGIVWRDIRLHYPMAVGTSSTPISAGDTTAPTNAANSRDIANYGVRAVGCTVDGTHAQGIVTSGSMAYQRCSLKFGTDRVTAGARVMSDTGDAATKYTMYDACEILINQGTGSTGVSEGWLQGENAGLVFLNTSFAMWGIRTAECRMFVQFAATQTIYARQSIFGFPDATAGTRKLFHGDSWNQTGTPRNFDDCAYVRITGFGYSQNESYWTPVLWLAAVDTHAQQFASANVFEEPTGGTMSHARLSRAANLLWTYRNTGTTLRTDMGINMKPWTGTEGCYQLNAGATRTWSLLSEAPPPPPPPHTPAMFVSFFTDAQTNPDGIRQDLYGDPEAYLESMFAKAGAAGITTVIFHVPIGHDDTGYYRADAYRSLPNHIRDAITLNMERWKAQYNIQHVGVYMGAVWGTAQAASSPVKPLMLPDWEDDAVAATLESWGDMGFDVIPLDATANRGLDQYSDSVDDQYDSLGGFALNVCGMTPWGEAMPVDDPVTTTAFDATLAARSSFLVLQQLYQSWVDDGEDSADLVAVHDGPLPSARLGFRWVYYGSEFTRASAQTRINQGYIVDAWNDVSASDLAWLAVQRPVTTEEPAGTPPPRINNRRRIGNRDRLSDG